MARNHDAGLITLFSNVSNLYREYSRVHDTRWLLGSRYQVQLAFFHFWLYLVVKLWNLYFNSSDKRTSSNYVMSWFPLLIGCVFKAFEPNSSSLSPFPLSIIIKTYPSIFSKIYCWTVDCLTNIRTNYLLPEFCFTVVKLDVILYILTNMIIYSWGVLEMYMCSDYFLTNLIFHNWTRLSGQAIWTKSWLLHHFKISMARHIT